MNSIKNVLLVYPEVPHNTYWSFTYALEFINKKSAMPPLGLITIASFFSDNYKLKLVDLNIEPLQDPHIIWADAIFISAMIVQKESFHYVIDRCNRLSKIVVVGGPYPTSCDKKIEGVNYFVLGEVEDIFQQFLDDLNNGSAKTVYRASYRPDISNNRVPRFDLLNMDAYATMSIQLSRGCPFKCEFCDIWKVYGNKPRLKACETVIAELDSLYSLGWCGPIFIVDDNFIGNKKRVKAELLPAVTTWQKEHNYIYRFFTEASINLAEDESLLINMRDAGFNEVFIGIETPSTEALKEIGKFQNIRCDMKKAVQTIQQHGMEVMAGFILGFDTDTEDIAERQINFIQQTGISKAMVGLLNALPGTELYKRLKKENRILNESSGNNTHCISTNFITKMGDTALRKGYLHIIATIYDKNLKNYFARSNRLLDNIGDSPLFRREVHFNDVKMLFKSIIKQPFTQYGYQYILFLIRNFIKNRNTFPEAVRICIMGHHFHTITQETLKAQEFITELDQNYSRSENQSYSLTISSKGVYSNIIKLWDEQKQNMQKTKNRINKIHKDFREYIKRQYYDVEEKTRALGLRLYDMVSFAGIANMAG